jgi:hypothetical protein
MSAFDDEGYDPGAFDTDSVARAPIELDHVEAVVKRMPLQFRGKPNSDKILQLTCRRFIDIEQAIADLKFFNTIDNAFGDLLLQLAKKVGQPQLDLGEELFRAVVSGRIASNRSSGAGNQILRIARLVLDRYAQSVGGGMQLAIYGAGFASYSLEIRNIDMDWTLAELLMSQFLRDAATGTGIRPVLYFMPSTSNSITDNSHAFSFSHLVREESDDAWGSVSDTTGGLWAAALE